MEDKLLGLSAAADRAIRFYSSRSTQFPPCCGVSAIIPQAQKNYFPHAKEKPTTQSPITNYQLPSHHERT